MIQLFWKLAILIITVNSFAYFVLGDTFNSDFQGQFDAFVPTDVQTGATITSSSQVKPLGFDVSTSNSSIEATDADNPISIPFLSPFYNAATILYNLMFNLLFGYFVWMQVFLPWPLVAAIGVPLFLIEVIGLFYLLSLIVSTIGSAVGFILGR